VAWKIDQNAREVRVGSEPTSVNNRPWSPIKMDEWKKDIECFVCCKKGHFQAECGHFAEGGRKGKLKGKGKGGGK
jgi:hypothetical protein